MTLPFEEVSALKKSREFLRALLDPKQTPRIPKHVRQRAGACLRHYPWDMRIEEKWPEVGQ